jgi:prepilin-type N-terminal cleavage/methylation domain-containing protein
LKVAGALMNRKGFTLVEMAIVLVVIGVILGMVVKGRDLVQGAKTKNFIVDVKNLENIQYSFFDRFGRFAGDCDLDGVVDATGLAQDIGIFSDTEAKLCENGVASNDINTAYNELKAVSILPNESNKTLADLNGGFGFSYYAQDSEGINVIVLRNVPCFAAVSLDSTIDKKMDGTNGKIRASASGNSAWTDAGCASNMTNGTINTVLFYYDRASTK